MENQNTQQLPVPELPHVDLPTPTINEHGQVTPQPPAAGEGGSKKSFKEIGKQLIEKYKSSSKNVKLLVIVGLVFLFSIFLLLIASLARGNKTVEVVSTPTPTPITSNSPLPEVAISNPSKYASDSGVLKIETDVDNLSKEMNSVDLRQSNLRVPTLDFDVKFQ